MPHIPGWPTHLRCVHWKVQAHVLFFSLLCGFLYTTWGRFRGRRQPSGRLGSVPLAGRAQERILVAATRRLVIVHLVSHGARMDGGFVSSFCFFVYVWFISLDGGLNFVALFCPVALPSCSSLVYVLVVFF